MNDAAKLIKLAEVTTFYVASMTGVSAAAMMGRERSERVATARFMVMALLRRAGLKLTKVGYLVGRDHCAVINGVKRVNAMEMQDEAFRQQMIFLGQALKNNHPELMPCHWSHKVEPITNAIGELQGSPEAIAYLKAFITSLA
jgi:hypothetical protein